MIFDKKDVIIETSKGTGPGGQHQNKTESAVKATHKPTGISVYVQGRKQYQNKKKAYIELEKKFNEHIESIKKQKKKEDRDKKIKESKRVRTYDYNKGVVYDHRTGKQASLKHVMKGNLDLLK